jgi:hypothetical protein
MKRPDSSARAAHSLNSNIRLYKYTPSQHFNPHYDDSVRDAKTGAASEWTLLIYLTGVEDGVQGGEVRMMGSVKNLYLIIADRFLSQQQSESFGIHSGTANAGDSPSS